MNREEQFRRNHRLFELFMKEAFRSPELVKAVPDKADIILLPDTDPELLKENLKMLRKAQDEGRHPLAIQIRLVPETRTVLMPQVKVLSSPDVASLQATQHAK